MTELVTVPNVHEIDVSKRVQPGSKGKIWVASCKCGKWGTPVPALATSPLEGDEDQKYTTFMIGFEIGREFEKHVQPIPIRASGWQVPL